MRVPGMRRKIADEARVIEHPSGDREVWWTDGISRRYTKAEIALMFMEAVERGATNPILERLTTAEERRQLYAGMQELASMDMAALVAAGDTTITHG